MTGVEKGRVAVVRANFPAAQGAPPQSSHDFKRKGDYNLDTELYGFICEYMARIGAPPNLSDSGPEMTTSLHSPEAGLVNIALGNAAV
jgi:hypothetical protein